VLMDHIGHNQQKVEGIVDILDNLRRGEHFSHLNRYEIDGKECLRIDRCLSIPKIDGILEEVLTECHRSRMTVHPE
jgi:hypothetical protein